MGYRLTVNQARIPNYAKSGQNISIMTQLSNSALGRYSDNDKLALFILDSNDNVIQKVENAKFDLRTLIEGEVTNAYTDIVIDASISAGTYKIGIGIVDEEGNPFVQFGMAGDDNNDRIYELGNIEIGNKAIKDVVKVYTSLSDIKLNANTTYQITFEYMPKFDRARFFFGDMGGYVFGVTTKKGGSNATVGYYKWQDISEELGSKTVTFTTGNYSDYVIKVGSDSYGEAPDISRIWVETIGGYTETFEDYDFDSYDAAYIINPKRVSFTQEEGEVISGKTSIKVKANDEGYMTPMRLNDDVFKLKPNTSYTLSFKYKPLSDVGKGGFFSVNKLSSSGKFLETIGEFYERFDTAYPISKTYTFTTDSTAAYNIGFGGYNGGVYSVDDITITENTNGAVINGYDYADIWFEFAMGNRDYYKFGISKTYELTFKYKIMRMPNEGGNFSAFLRSESGTGTVANKGIIEFGALTTSQIGKVETFTTIFTTGEFSDYLFWFSMKNQGGIIVIDDFSITVK